jgi:hypothetical protein
MVWQIRGLDADSIECTQLSLFQTNHKQREKHARLSILNNLLSLNLANAKDRFGERKAPRTFGKELKKSAFQLSSLMILSFILSGDHKKWPDYPDLTTSNPCPCKSRGPCGSAIAYTVFHARLCLMSLSSLQSFLNAQIPLIEVEENYSDHCQDLAFTIGF